MLLHYIAEIKRTRDIVVIVEQRLGAGLADSLKTCKMDAAVDVVLFKYLVERVVIEKINLVELEVLTRYLLYALERLSLTVYEVINYYELSSSLKKLNHCV